MRMIVAILAFLLIVSTAYFGVQVDLLDDRIRAQATLNTEVILDAHKRMDEITGAVTDFQLADKLQLTPAIRRNEQKFQEAVDELQIEINELKKNTKQLQDTIDKVNETNQSFLDKPLGEPQKFTKEKADTRNQTIAKLKKDIKKLEQTINYFQYQRQHGGLK